MSGSPQQLGDLWIERGRPEKAEPEYRRALALDPEDAGVRASLAQCLMLLDRNEEALSLARSAVGEDPDNPHVHHVLAIVLINSDQEKEAEKVIRSVLAMDAESAGVFGTLAQAMLGQRRWQEALEAAESGLALDPEHGPCLNMRGLALVQLGKRDEASEGLHTALRHDPEDPTTHFVLGMSALHAGRHHEAARHFSEALRLDPEFEGARAGLVDALKAKQGLYRPFLAWFLFLGRIPTKTAYMLFIATIFARKFLKEASEAYPDFAPLFMGLYVAMIGFILMSWIAEPLFDLVLRLSPEGRYALSEKEVFRSNCLGAVLALALIFLVAGFAGVPTMFVASGVMAVWAIPMVRALREAGKTRWIHRVAAAVLLLLGFVSFFQINAFDRWHNSLSPELIAVLESTPQERVELLISYSDDQRHAVEAQLPGLDQAADHAVAQRDLGYRLLGAFALLFMLQTWIL